MKLVSYRSNGVSRLGVLDAASKQVSALQLPDGRALGPRDANDVIGMTMGRHNLESAGLTAVDEALVDDVTLEAPLQFPPKNVFCIGKNYFEHSVEFDQSGYDATSSQNASSSVPEFPIVFTKARNTITGTEKEVDAHADLTQSLDYEAELAVIIGRGGKRISQENAWDHVWGLTLVNDLTARELQQRHKQWFIGKSIDGFLPMGPWAASMDELTVDEIELSCYVNGERRQHAPIRDLIFDIPTIIETLSAGTTLEVGDIIATGTPAGVGIGFEPSRFLQAGDVVEVTGTGLGVLTNRIAG